MLTFARTWVPALALPYFGQTRNCSSTNPMGAYQWKIIVYSPNCQAFQLNVHFTIEQAGRCVAGHFLQFNGTAGIWKNDPRLMMLEDGRRIRSLKIWSELPGSDERMENKLYRRYHLSCRIACWNLRIKNPNSSDGWKAVENSRKLLPTILKSNLPFVTKFLILPCTSWQVEFSLSFWCSHLSVRFSMPWLLSSQGYISRFLSIRYL